MVVVILTLETGNFTTVEMKFNFYSIQSRLKLYIICNMIGLLSRIKVFTYSNLLLSWKGL